MLKLALCDDDRAFASSLEKVIRSYSKEFDVTVFNDPADLIDSITDGRHFNLYILDIIMPGFSGIELARRIRCSDHECVIIFLTSSDSFHRDAYGLEALQYLEKPVDKTMLFHTLDRAVKLAGEKNNTVLPIRTASGIHAVEINRIVYVESFRHVLTFHICNNTTIKTLDSSLSLEKLSESISADSFCRPHRSYIVNMAYVECLRKLQLIMTTGHQVPIAQKKLGVIRTQYSNYLLSFSKGD